jgi:arsenate reductase-like glutaredoxin family protein
MSKQKNSLAHTPTIYMDESGGLSFDFSKKKTTKNFVVSFLFTENPREVDKAVRKIFAGFNKAQIKAHHGVLHAYKETPRTRVKLLRLLNDKNISILTIRLNKKRVYTQLQDQKHVLYNYVVNILLDRMISKKLIPLDSQIRFVASKRETSKFLNENFSNYLKNQTKSHHRLDIAIDILTPHQEKGLQAVDQIAWSFFRKYEHDDNTYADIVRDKVVEESELFR